MNHLEMIRYIKNELNAKIVKLEVGDYDTDEMEVLDDDEYRIVVIKDRRFLVYAINERGILHSEADCLISLAKEDFAEFTKGNQ